MEVWTKTLWQQKTKKERPEAGQYKSHDSAVAASGPGGEARAGGRAVSQVSGALSSDVQGRDRSGCDSTNQRKYP